MTRRFSLRLTMLAVTLLLLLSACGGASDTPTSVPAATATTAPAAPTDTTGAAQPTNTAAAAQPTATTATTSGDTSAPKTIHYLGHILA